MGEGKESGRGRGRRRGRGRDRESLSSLLKLLLGFVGNRFLCPTFHQQPWPSQRSACTAIG
eukprot:12910411-Prorocentrum_lima.AAC.1